MPDIDTDFCIERRGEVIDYVNRKYGADRVAQCADPLRRVFDPDRCVRGSRVHAAGRGSADHAPLQGLPEELITDLIKGAA